MLGCSGECVPKTYPNKNPITSELDNPTYTSQPSQQSAVRCLLASSVRNCQGRVMQLFPGVAFSTDTQPCSTYERGGNLHARTQLFRTSSDPVLMWVSNRVPLCHLRDHTDSCYYPVSFYSLCGLAVGPHAHPPLSVVRGTHTQTTQERKRPLLSITELPCGKVHHEYTSSHKHTKTCKQAAPF